MPNIKVYGILSSPPTLRVLASLFEHELHFDFIPINTNDEEHKKEPFLSLNPFGQLLAFQDGELALFESRAIMRYVAFGYPKPGKEHIYEDPLIQGVVAGWIDVEDHVFEPLASKLIEELVFKPESSLIPDDVVVAKEEAELGKVLDVYEERLMASTYLGGKKFTSADLTHLPHLHYLMRTPVMKHLLESRPHVGAWCKNIMSRPAWLQVVDMVHKS